MAKRKITNSPVFLSLMGNFTIPVVITACYAYGMGMAPLPVWLFAVNLLTLAVLGKDKFASRREWTRTPEITLLALTFAGGTLATLIGRILFNHKTTKPNFVAALWGTITAQALCIYYFREPLLHWLQTPLPL